MLSYMPPKGWAGVVVLAAVVVAGCTMTPAIVDDDEAICSAAGDACDSESPCCDPLVCSNGVCETPADEVEPDQGDVVALADFSADDVNSQSPRFGESVSPRDYLGQVSAWYYGHST